MSQSWLQGFTIHCHENIKVTKWFDCLTGSLTFTHAIKLFEKDDEEIAEMAADLKTRFIPLLPRPPLFVPRDVTWPKCPKILILQFKLHHLKTRFILLLPRPPLFVPRDVTWPKCPKILILQFKLHHHSNVFA